jgi:diguanylate cyclase (GGDEF)-like protein
MDSLFPGRRTTVAVHSERPTSSGKPCLIVISGAVLGKRVELGEADVEIGRSDASTLCIASDQVSRRHATVIRIAGRYHVTDHDSTNGTFVNEERVKTAELRDGDQIRIGKTVLKYTESPVESEYFEHIMTLASQDALTRAFNKRKFDEIFPAEVTRAQSAGSPFSLLLFDIDFFKKINDQFGHLAGDAVLQEIAGLASAVIGPGGALCRVGGEEFTILLPGSALDVALETAEYLRSSVEQQAFVFEGKTIPVTISIGAAELEEGEESEAFYKRTDDLLYRSKKSGRNRVSG